MSARVYLLLDIVEGKSAYAIQTVQSKAGVLITDILEGRPDIIVMVEAPNRKRLAELVMPVLSSLDGIVNDVHLLVAQQEKPASASHSTRTMKTYSKYRETVGEKLSFS